MRDTSILLKKVSCTILLLLAITALLSARPALAPDEQVLVLPTTASLEEDTWKIPLKGWVFEMEHDSSWRKFQTKIIARKLKLGERSESNSLFIERAWMFLVDNQRGKRIKYRLGDKEVICNRSRPNGHFEGSISMSKKPTGPGSAYTWMRINVVPPPGDERRFEGYVQLVPPEGISVISDIDDTIKDSVVLDKKELMANTFLRPCRAISGMAKQYAKWQEKNVVFHYVSGSPWQLTPMLTHFIEEKGFPRGSFHLRMFRIYDSSMLNLLKNPFDQKVRKISAILKRYPRRKFIFVGDSGEADADVYGEIARRYPDQLLHIFIRNVELGKMTQERVSVAFKDIPQDKWTVFEDAKELGKLQF